MYRLRSKNTPYILRDSVTGKMLKVVDHWVDFQGLPVGMMEIGDKDIEVQIVPAIRSRRSDMLA